KYRRIVEKVRKSSDVLLHPTLGANSVGVIATENRMAHIRRLAAEGLKPDLAPIDVATANVDHFDPAARCYTSEDRVYINTTGTLQYLATNLRALGVKPFAVIWSIPSLRHAAALARAGFLETPLFVQLGTSPDTFPSFHPATIAGIEAFLPFLPDAATEWS